MTNKRSNIILSSSNKKVKKTRDTITPEVMAAIRALLEDGIDNNNTFSSEVFFVDSKTNKEIPQTDSTGADDVAQVLAGTAKWVPVMEEHADEVDDYDEASDKDKIKIAIRMGHLIDRESIRKAWSQIENDEEYAEIKAKVIPSKQRVKDEDSDNEDEKSLDDIDGQDNDQFVQLCMFREVRFG
jgi:hypothetical protein